MDYQVRCEMIDLLCSMPNDQVNDSLKPRLQALKKETHSEILDELLGIIEDCKHTKLLDTFEDVILNAMWKEISGWEPDGKEWKEREKTLKNLTTEQFQKLKLKYKWEYYENNIST